MTPTPTILPPVATSSVLLAWPSQENMYIFVFFVVQSGQVPSEKFMYIGHWRIGEPDYWPVTRRSSDLVMTFPNTVTMYYLVGDLEVRGRRPLQQFLQLRPRSQPGKVSEWQIFSVPVKLLNLIFYDIIHNFK